MKTPKKETINIKEILARNTDNIKVTEVNKPNIDQMAMAFLEILKK